MNIYKLILLFAIHLLIYCSLMDSDHIFDTARKHSFEPGTSKLDSLSVLAIFEVNGIPADSFSSVVKIGSDWRVHSLYLDNLGIDTLPPQIGNLGELEHLDISNNNLRSLPDSIIRISLLNINKYCFGATGSYSCRSETSNGLVLDYNMLCDVKPEVSEWIDRHFKMAEYIKSDQTQRCP